MATTPDQLRLTQQRLNHQLSDSSDFTPPSSDGSGADRVAVILTGYGEVEDYDNFATYNRLALNVLTRKFAPIPKVITPAMSWYLANSDRQEWEIKNDHFISPHNAIFEQQRAGIETCLQARWGDRVQVFKAFNFCPPFLPEQVVGRIKEQGFNKILIYPLLVVDSIFTSGIALEQINQGLEASTEGDRHWVEGIRYIPSFFDRPAYIDLLARQVEDRVSADLASDYYLSQIGIVLMNHGCPEEANGYVTGIRESQGLYDQVRDKLVNRFPLISVGWLNHDTPFVKWTKPDADQAAENLIELGAKAILFVPIGFATDNHETILDVNSIIDQLHKDHPHIAIERMDCVNDHPEFLQMVADWANPEIEALFSESVSVNPPLAAATADAHSDHPWHQHSH
ncbi:MAG: ferrochelatase [Elainellaceae cyanobacterium]